MAGGKIFPSSFDIYVYQDLIAFNNIFDTIADLSDDLQTGDLIL